MEHHNHMMLDCPVGLSQGELCEPDAVMKLHGLGGQQQHQSQQQQQDIGGILQQIMGITEESLDEAQAR